MTQANDRPHHPSRPVKLQEEFLVGAVDLRPLGFAPADIGYGFDVDQWASVVATVHPSTPSFAAAVTLGWSIRLIPWVYREAASHGSRRPSGQWFALDSWTVPLDGTGIMERVFLVGTAKKLYLQPVSWEDAPVGTPVVALGAYGLVTLGEPGALAAAVVGPAPVLPLATHGDVVIALGPQVMDEAKAFDGSALPNAVAEGDAVRAASTLVGARYAFLVNKDGAHTPIAGHGETIDAVKGGDWGVMEVDEAKAFDGAALPNPVGEGLAVRASATLSGVRYGFAVNKDGSGTPVATHGAAISAANGGSVGNMPVLEAKNYDGVFIPNPVAEGQAVRPAGTLSGVSYIFPSTQDGAATPILREGLAISAANGGNAILIAGAEARSSSPALETEGDGVRLIADLAKALIVAGYQYATTAIRMNEINPLSAQIAGSNGGATLADVTNVAALGTTYYPDANGYAIDGFTTTILQLLSIGGVEPAPTNCTNTLTIEATTGLKLAGVDQWRDISASIFNEETGALWAGSLVGTGAAASQVMLFLGHRSPRRIRVKSVVAGAANPTVTNATTKATLTASAL